MSIPRDEQPLVSVVTPVYNGADYLAECIESVIGQTYENWEHVIVDNCSTDGTLEIARSYEARDPRIRVESPGGFVDLVESGNRSLREISAESKYTKVLHADDWLFSECIGRMVELAEQNPTVGVVSAYRLEEFGVVTLTGLSPSISVLSGREICRSTLIGEPLPHLFGSPTSLLIRSDLVRARDPFYEPFSARHAPVTSPTYPAPMIETRIPRTLDQLVRQADPRPGYYGASFTGIEGHAGFGPGQPELASERPRGVTMSAAT